MAAEKTIVQELGNLPGHRVTFYQDGKKPEVPTEKGQRVSMLYYKTNKETNLLRSSMAVLVNQIDWKECRDTEKGAEFLQALVNEVQDSIVKRAADKQAEFSTAELADKMVADYFDNSRTTNGRRVSADMVGAFFDSYLQDWLLTRVISKFPQFHEDKAAKVVLQYRAAMVDLTKYSLPHSKQVSEMLQKAWMEFQKEESYEDSELADWITERIQKLIDRHNANEMLIEVI